MQYLRTLANGLLLVALFTLVAAPLVASGVRYQQDAELAATEDRYSDAAEYYEQAARRLFWDDTLWGEAGRAALMAGDLAGAVRLFGEAQNLSARNGLALGDAYWQIGQPAQAIDVWQELLRTGQASGDLYERLVKAYWETGEYAAAIENLHLLVDLEPGNAGAHYQLGLLLTATHPEQALPHLMRAASLDPQLDPAVQILRAGLNRALLEDDRAYQYAEAGRSLASLGNWALAAEAFRNALSINPQYAEAAAWLGETYFQLGQDGYPYLQMALKLEPNLAVVHVFYGLYWQRSGKLEIALAEFREAASLEPQNPAWQILAGDASARSGDVMAALVYFEQAVLLAPTEPDYYQALVIFCVQYNVEISDTALPAALQLVALAPNDWQSWDALGQVAMATGSLDEAEGLYLKALGIATQEAAIHLHLGILYLQTNEPVSAYDHLVKAKTYDVQDVYDAQVERLLERYFP